MQPGLLLLSCAVLVALGLPAGAAPDEDLLGKAAGYPVGSRVNWFYDERVRVGSFSVGKESFARERDALWRGVVGRYGSW
jgi:hypothetical protein